MSFYGNANDTLWYKESRLNKHGGETTISVPVRFELGKELEAAKKGEALGEEFFKDFPEVAVEREKKRGLWPFN